MYFYQKYGIPVDPVGPLGFRIFGAIDCSIFGTATPGSGPAVAGPNAPRLPNAIQMAAYTGYKKKHGVKVQTINLANGLFFHVTQVSIDNV